TPVLRGELQAVESSLPRRERTASPADVMPAAPSSPPAAVSQAEVSREAGDVIGQGAVSLSTQPPRGGERGISNTFAPPRLMTESAGGLAAADILPPSATGR